MGLGYGEFDFGDCSSFEEQLGIYRQPESEKCVRLVKAIAERNW